MREVVSGMWKGRVVSGMFEWVGGECEGGECGV